MLTNSCKYFVAAMFLEMTLLSGGKTPAEESSALNLTPQHLREERLKNGGDTKTPYSMAVYLNSHSHPSNLQMPQMLASLANVGVTRLIVNPRVYLELAPQGLNTVAKRWGMELVVGMAPDPCSPISTNYTENEIRESVKLINSYPDSDVVIGWYLSDEIELNYGKRFPAIGIHLAAISKLFKKYDPARKTFVNHHDDRTNSDGKLLFAGEECPSCSVFWANHFAIERLREVKSLFRTTYGENVPLVAVFGAQGTRNALTTETNLQFNKVVGIDLKQVSKIPVRQDIADYVATPFSLGFAGTAFFVYDGYYDYDWYSIVDERGRSKEGRLEGIRDGMAAVRAAEGCPSLAMEVDKEKMRIQLKPAAIDGKPVDEVVLEYSNDGGYSWKPIPDVRPDTQSVSIPQFGFSGLSWMQLEWTMIRSRCAAGGKRSLWTVWNTFGWRNRVSS